MFLIDFKTVLFYFYKGTNYGNLIKSPEKKTILYKNTRKLGEIMFMIEIILEKKYYSFIFNLFVIFN